MMAQTIDIAPGPYYVSAVDGNRYFLMAGPYDNHAQALADVDRARVIADERDPRACFMSWGTCRSRNGDRGPGALNKAGLI